MPRTMTTTAAATIASNYVRLHVFVQLGFLSSTEYVWSGRGPIVWNGQTWQGVGDLGGLSPISEDSTLTAQSLTITLSGVRPGLLVEALTEVQLGQPAYVWVVLMDSQCNPVDSISCFAGLMDQPTLTEGSDSDSISIEIESRLADLQRAQFARLTDQQQRQDYPTDDGFKFVTQLQDWNGSWGSK